MISSFRRDIKSFVRQEVIWQTKEFCVGLVYTVVFFCASLRGSEGLNLDLNMLKRYISGGVVQYRTPHHNVTPNIVIPLHGQFKGERGERCHLLPLFKTFNTGVKI